MPATNELPKAYVAQDHEDRIYQQWEKSGAFTPTLDPKQPRAKRFTIPIPPPNANGSLHLGHASFLTYQDIMIRWHRMLGDVTLWIPGTDHAGIQTQVVFERELQKQGKTRDDLGPDEFYKQCFKFCMKNKETIITQMKKVGASCDWTREKFTLDEDLLRRVKGTFVRMYQEGLAYRGERIIHWCVRCATSLSDMEVQHKQTPMKLYTIQYGPLQLATTRPETKFGDTAVAVHPSDKRYTKYVGHTIDIETILGPAKIKVIADKRVDPKFGTGVIKVTPAHDPLDFEIGQDHGLEIRQVIEKDGKLNAKAGKFADMPVAEAREAVAAEMKEKGLLIKEEDYVAPLSVCERCKNPIQPLISEQWFIKMDSLAKPAIEAISKGELKIIPRSYVKVYLDRLRSLKDWNISRQIWWGPRMPVWYCKDCGEVIVQLTGPSACPKCNSTRLRAETDTFDTWFSSGQWPITILGGPENGGGKADMDKVSEDFKYFYPTSVLETGWEILLLWVTRMVMFGYYITGKSPFHVVYLHGMVTDKNGQKMSKSKGNGIDPLDMTAKYGTDALRLSLIIGTKPGLNLRLYEEKIAGYRNFVNKLWNVARFIMTQPVEAQGAKKSTADKWILSRIETVKTTVSKHLKNYEFAPAGDMLYDFVWHEFADWYIEVSKIHPNQAVAEEVLETTLKLLHPFIPFITEHIWQQLKAAGTDAAVGKGQLLISAAWPKPKATNVAKAAEKNMNNLFEIIKAVRNTRSEYTIAPGKMLHASSKTKLSAEAKEIIQRLARLELQTTVTAGITNLKNINVLGGGYTLTLNIGEVINVEQELVKTAKAIKQLEGYLGGLEQKLANKGYLAKAPQEVVAKDTEKLHEAEERLKKLLRKSQELDGTIN
ncbi:MAG: valine--tRNA ligase [Candidatus Kerfeldbacteria bacterium RIFCSPHIGHO2_12_FULL_48_17]|uniref:Valine--tRNA ligase n=1 Tax=Candidatus Kerfeldbacteria bacterium RIFCSPHIGHO2_12_FULL_48_17 TaxID=1798542 RepID=A0A1G2B8U5_9BACT|nr:MAG: valine--tRNA ligase [Candidatus Kerfeldbacteria bacterium RIFCSPHIGHO2_12_FULL_48_17]